MSLIIILIIHVLFFHHYKHDDYWIKNKIDFINTIMLDNFTVLWNEVAPTILFEFSKMDVKKFFHLDLILGHLLGVNLYRLQIQGIINFI